MNISKEVLKSIKDNLVLQSLPKKSILQIGDVNNNKRYYYAGDMVFNPETLKLYAFQNDTIVGVCDLSGEEIKIAYSRD